MSIVVPIIVIIIIGVQIYFFSKNIKRMDEYRRIFEKSTSWGINHDVATDFVTGIRGEGNAVFDSIKESINKYLGNNSGSVIDFQLLKDAVDRHCDSVENDVNTLTPIPLYCGLAGTMAGVIVGLSSLLYTGSITALLSSGSGNFGAAADGVNDLLSGVAWAMLASICGIIFTTWGSILFKSRKIQGEAGKNTFLAWLQAKLLPELPSDTSEALNNLVKNLNKFNATFSINTEELRGALSEVNHAYNNQAEIIKYVHDMDVMKMAKANVKVLEELKDCTDKLEQFNEYLDGIHGYTYAIDMFTKKFERLQIFDELKAYFERHKAELSKAAGDTDRALGEALKTLKEHAYEDTSELNKTLTEQAEEFKRIIKEQKETFEGISSDMAAKFSAAIKQFPDLEKRLAEVSAIPQKLDTLIAKIEKANGALASKVSDTMKQTSRELSVGGTSGTGAVGGGFPSWMKWTIVASAVVIAVACLANTAYNILYVGTGYSAEQSDSTYVDDTIDVAPVTTVASATMPSDTTITIN